jgi:undecaprenol kinase
VKNRTFIERINFAWSGIRVAFQEKSFRTQVACGIAVLGAILYFRRPVIWSALLIICIGSVLAMELYNTALETALDRLHPERHPTIRKAKDCAAGAVLVMSITSVIVFLCFLISS